MDYLTELGPMALGSRMKRLSERIIQEVAIIYSQQNIEFEPRWFPIFHLLGKKSAATITDIAKEVGITHPAVNQIAQEMLDAELIVEVTDTNDKRKRLLSLSKKGQKLHKELEHTWRVMRVSVSEAIDQCGHDLIKAMDSMEKTLDKQNLPSRFILNDALLRTSKVEIIDFQPEYRHQFRELNEAWLSKLFTVEQADLDILCAPERIIKDGGNVFFARLGDKVIGTCALVKIDKHTYEVAKMAVSDDYQGLGIGRMLLNACINRAQKLKAKFVTLETNTTLTAAVQLYKKTGFKPIPMAEAHPSKFSRVDLVMKLDLQTISASV